MKETKGSKLGKKGEQREEQRGEREGDGGTKGREEGWKVRAVGQKGWVGRV